MNITEDSGRSAQIVDRYSTRLSPWVTYSQEWNTHSSSEEMSPVSGCHGNRCGDKFQTQFATKRASCRAPSPLSQFTQMNFFFIPSQISLCSAGNCHLIAPCFVVFVTFCENPTELLGLKILRNARISYIITTKWRHTEVFLNKYLRCNTCSTLL